MLIQLDDVSWLLLAPAIAVGLLLAWHLFSRWSNLNTSRTNSFPNDPYQDIEPLEFQDWKAIEPMKIRPFRPKFYLTMGLENCPLSEYLAFDNTYLERTKIRTAVLNDHPKETHDSNPKAEAAVMEMYEWMFGTYLPKRLPTLFKLVPRNGLPNEPKSTTANSERYLHNTITGEYIPLEPPSAKEALHTLGRNVDDDILILLPGSEAEDGSPIYHLEAYVCCFPSGFSLPEKFGLPLAAIHAPVPNYAPKLAKSMDRFFAKLETGRAVRRANWSITTDDKLYTQAGNHLYANGETVENPSIDKNEKTLDVHAPDLEATIAEQKKDVVIDKCRLRCERQTLHRLPRSQALVFAFKTFQYLLADVKGEEGGDMAEALAQAVEGLDKGNSPEMKFYKRGVVWGEKVVEFLRS